MSDIMKVNMHYGGYGSVQEDLFDYKGGLVKEDMIMDPDYVTWSIFDELCEGNEISGVVEKVWYKLRHEEISLARVIYDDKDNQIRQMCMEAMTTTGEIDIYIHLMGCGGHDESDGEEPVEAEVEDKGEEPVEDKGEDPVEEVGGDDPRFETLFNEVHSGHGDETDGQCAFGGGGQCAFGVIEGEVVVDDQEYEKEFERQCVDDEHPDPALDTDDEWEAFNREERAVSIKNYVKDQPPYLWLEQTFQSGEEFKDQLLRYVLKANYDVKLSRWGSTQLAAICTNKKCKWAIFCSLEKPKHKWIMKRYYDVHNHNINSKARMLKQTVVARLFREEARRRPAIRWTDIKDEIMMRYNLSVSKWICQKARRIALNMVIETQAEQFSKLWDYEAELKRSNEGIHSEIVTIPQADGKQRFDKFYISFEVLRRTWKKCCRPIIGLDGAFLKWELKGEILAAVGRDADNRIYPIAWAIVRVEDNDSWGWFVDKLKQDLGLGFGNGYTIISDKQKGLINAVAEKLPNAEHRHYARHIFANWSKVYGVHDYENLFWSVAFSGNEGDYNFNMRALKNYNTEAHEDLLKTEPMTWCRAFFSSNAVCEDVNNNLSESFNKTIKESRKMPVIDMLEDVRRQTMKRISKRYEKTMKCQTKFTPHIMQMYEANRQAAKLCQVLKSSESLYEVKEGKASFEVNISQRHCGCNQWNITGIPCPHTITIITEHNRDPDDYVDKHFLTSWWQETYSDNIKPVRGERMWKAQEKGPIEVPEKRKQRGRPKKYARIKEAHESSKNPNKVTRDGRTMTCSNCKGSGHNKSTCDKPTAPLYPPRKRGRPRKRPIGDHDPWSIQNAPKRLRTVQSQSTPTVSLSQSTPTDPSPSTTPPSTTGRGRGSDTPKPRRGHPPGSRGKGRGRGKGLGRGSDAPKPPVFFMSPWTNTVFDAWRPQDP